MIYLLYISNIILFPILFYLLDRNYKLSRDKIVKEIDKDNLRLPIPKYDIPTIESIDTNHTLLNDVIESIKIEKWGYEVTEDRSGVFSKSYMISLKNPSDSISIRTRLYVRTDNQTPSLGSFTILTSAGNLTYNSNNKEASFLILAGIWSYIIEHHDKENEKEVKKLNNLRSVIENGLVTLKRDKSLEKFLKQIENK